MFVLVTFKTDYIRPVTFKTDYIRPVTLNLNLTLSLNWPDIMFSFLPLGFFFYEFKVFNK